jgi:mono/diheme cytochrome c family protein
MVLATASYAWAVPPGDAAAGKTVYTRSCASCHGANGQGNPAIAKMLKSPPMRALGSKEVLAKSDAELKKNVSEGYGKMPPTKSLSPKQVDDVVAYMRTLGK